MLNSRIKLVREDEPGHTNCLFAMVLSLMAFTVIFQFDGRLAHAQTAALGTPDFYANQPFGGVAYGTQPPVVTAAPTMPPPPGVVAGSPMVTARQPVVVGQAPYVMNQPPVIQGQPPVIQGAPPVAQGFGSSAVVAPQYSVTQPAPVIAQPAPYGAGGIAMDDYVRFVQAIRIQYTWLSGDGNNVDEFDINDIEGAVTFSYPDFLYSQDPLLITPGFILHVWDPPPNPGAPIPPRAYSAYLDFFWAPRMSPQLSAELDFRIGVYSDFESVSSNAIRPQGYGAGIYQMSQATAIKLGATYINRVDVKLLPVVGIIYTPDQTRRWDITFPNPKISNYVTTVGNADVWGYLAGEYGGGSWEIDNFGDRRMDINDIRAIAGIEWIGGFSTKGFIEVGYVFNREVFSPGFINRDLDDTFMLRGGLTF